MNPMTNIKNVQKLNERELELGMIGKKSWHDDYKDSAWIFIGGLPFDLSEGDVICVFSQYGEVVNFNLVRDHKTGKSKGFAFLCYEDQRSTVLTVDNLNGIKILGRTIRVDHVKDYKVPKDHKDDDEMVRQLREQGCAPQLQQSEPKEEEVDQTELNIKKKEKKKKGDKKKKKKEKKKSASRQQSSSGSSHSESEDTSRSRIKIEPLDIKQEKEDKGYLKAYLPSSSRENGKHSRSRENGADSRERDNSRKRHRHNSSDSDDFQSSRTGKGHVYENDSWNTSHHRDDYHNSRREREDRRGERTERDRRDERNDRERSRDSRNRIGGGRDREERGHHERDRYRD